ncbi:MAG TPA: histidine kinase, partial [Prosthecobacter sp.]|nr:histidine kinase [Prosthecobacter sp.]
MSAVSPRVLILMLMASGAPSLRAADEAITTWNPLRLMAEKAGLRARIEEDAHRLAAMPEARVVAQSHGRVGFHGRAAAPAWIVLDLGKEAAPDEVVLLPARVSDPAPDDPVEGFPPELKCLMSMTVEEGSFQVMNEWAEPAGGAGARLAALRLRNPRGLSGRFLRIEITGGRPRARGMFFSLGEVWALKDGVNLALGAPVESSASIDNPPRWTAANLTDGFIWCGSTTGTEKARKNGFHSRIESSPDAVPKWVEVVLDEAMPVDEIRLVPARPADFADVTGFGFPPEFQVLAWADDSPDEKPVVVFDTGGAGFANPGDATVCLPAHGVKTRRVRVVAGRLWRRTSDYIFALAEMQVMSAGRNAALGREVRFSDIVESASWTPEALVDGFGSQRALLDAARWLDEMDARAALEAELLPARAGLAVLELASQRQLLLAVEILVIAMLVVLAAAAILLVHQRRARAELRARIARDLHDEIGSQLSHLALLAETGGADADAALRAIKSGARETQQA